MASPRDDGDDGGVDPTHLQLLETEPIIKHGYLTKKGKTRHNWKQRWFELRASTLSYSSSPQSPKKLGIVPLFGCSIRSHQLRPFSFVLEAPRRAYYLSAESLDDECEWMKCITQAIGGVIGIARDSPEATKWARLSAMPRGKRLLRGAGRAADDLAAAGAGTTNSNSNSTTVASLHHHPHHQHLYDDSSFGEQHRSPSAPSSPMQSRKTAWSTAAAHYTPLFEPSTSSPVHALLRTFGHESPAAATATGVATSTSSSSSPALSPQSGSTPSSPVSASPLSALDLSSAPALAGGKPGSNARASELLALQGGDNATGRSPPSTFTTAVAPSQAAKTRRNLAIATLRATKQDALAPEPVVSPTDMTASMSLILSLTPLTLTPCAIVCHNVMPMPGDNKQRRSRRNTDPGKDAELAAALVDAAPTTPTSQRRLSFHEALTELPVIAISSTDDSPTAADTTTTTSTNNHTTRSPKAPKASTLKTPPETPPSYNQASLSAMSHEALIAIILELQGRNEQQRQQVKHVTEKAALLVSHMRTQMEHLHEQRQLAVTQLKAKDATLRKSHLQLRQTQKFLQGAHIREQGTSSCSLYARCSHHSVS